MNYFGIFSAFIFTAFAAIQSFKDNKNTSATEFDEEIWRGISKHVDLSNIPNLRLTSKLQKKAVDKDVWIRYQYFNIFNQVTGLKVWKFPTPKQLAFMHPICGYISGKKAFLDSVHSIADREWLASLFPQLDQIINHSIVVFITIVERHGFNHKLAHYAFEQVMAHLTDSLDNRPNNFNYELKKVLNVGWQVSGPIATRAFRNAVFRKLVDRTLSEKQPEKRKVDTIIGLMFMELEPLIYGIHLVEQRLTMPPVEDNRKPGRIRNVMRDWRAVGERLPHTLEVLIGLVADLCDLMPHIPRETISRYIGIFQSNGAPVNFAEFDENRPWSELARAIIDRYGGVSGERGFLDHLNNWLPPVMQLQDLKHVSNTLNLPSHEDFAYSCMTMDSFHRLLDLCSVVAFVPNHPIRPSSILLKHFLLDMIFKPDRDKIISDEQQIQFYNRIVTNQEMLQLSNLPFEHALVYKRANDLCKFLGKSALLADDERIEFAKGLLRVLEQLFSSKICDQDGHPVPEMDKWTMSINIIMNGIGLVTFEAAVHALGQEYLLQPEHIFLECLKTLMSQHVRLLRAKHLDFH